MKKKISLDIGFGHSHSAIESGYEPYKIGQWVRNYDDQMLVNELESKLDYKKICYVTIV